MKTNILCLCVFVVLLACFSHIAISDEKPKFQVGGISIGDSFISARARVIDHAVQRVSDRAIKLHVIDCHDSVGYIMEKPFHERLMVTRDEDDTAVHAIEFQTDSIDLNFMPIKVVCGGIERTGNMHIDTVIDSKRVKLNIEGTRVDVSLQKSNENE